MGELSLLEGRAPEARSLWERVKTEGRDPVWQKLAIQALADLEWREEVKRKIPALSN
jgi:hypothetical protein